MDCDTTGVEPDFALVKFKKLAGGGYFKIINASIPPALRPARLHARADRGDRPLLPRRRHAARLPAHQSRPASRPRASPTKCCKAIEAQLPGAFELPFVFNRWTLGDDILQEPARSSAEEQIDAPGFDLLTALGFTRAADRRGQRLCLRHHDHRRSAAPEAGALCRSSTAPTSAARSASASCRPKSHIRMMAAAQPFICGAISKTINMPHCGHRRGRQERLPAELAADAQGQRPVPRRLQAEPAAQQRGRRS